MVYFIYFGGIFMYKYFKKIFEILIYSFLYLNFIGICFAIDFKDVTPKVNKCTTCHTITGNSTVSMWPNLAEQHPDYMLKQLFEFKKGKDGDRFDPTMFGMLQGVTESELSELSKYFSEQVLEKKKVKINKEQFTFGKEIYFYGIGNINLASCVGCHGFDGKGNKLANFPHLRWQHKEYLITQMKKFKSGDRSTDVNNIMRDVVSNMTDDQMDAVATYISCMD